MRLIDYFDRGAALLPDRHCLYDGARGWTTLREPYRAGRERKI
jgi:hypothetical protein